MSCCMGQSGKRGEQLLMLNRNTLGHLLYELFGLLGQKLLAKLLELSNNSKVLKQAQRQRLAQTRPRGKCWLRGKR